MKSPICRTCGKAEWDHVCGSDLPSAKVPNVTTHAAMEEARMMAADLPLGTIAPPGQCPYCDNRRAVNTKVAKARRQKAKGGGAAGGGTEPETISPSEIVGE